MEPTNGWIGVDWDPKTPLLGRTINGKTPTAANSDLFLSIQLDFIGARYSSDPIENDSFRKTYNEGLKTLLTDRRAFWFQVTSMHYAGPDQIGGVLLLDVENGPTIQADMVRDGYAVVEARDSTRELFIYGDDYRDKLLRLEGEAHAYQLGVWAPSSDPKLLPPDKALERLELAARDPAQTHEVREKAIIQLLKDGDQNKYLDLAIMFAAENATPFQPSQAFCTGTFPCRLARLSEPNQKKYLQYAYNMLEQINDGQGGGYFLAMDIGSCIDIKPVNLTAAPFTPDPKLPQYDDAIGNRGKNYFQDTVNNALAWWNEHKAQYQ